MADPVVSDGLGEACRDVRLESWGMCLFAVQTCFASQQLQTQARQLKAISKSLREERLRLLSQRL
jgi:hypothetical protein